MSTIQKELLTQLASGSEKAFEILYQCYAGKLFGFAMNFTRQDRYASEEVVQHVFMKIWEHRANIKNEHSFFSYLCSITKNHLINQYERRTVEYIYQNYISKTASESDSTTEADLDRRFLEGYILQLVEALPPARQKIFRMSRYEYLSNRDIAKRLGISESTVENQLSSALKYFKKKISLHSNYISTSTILLFIFNK